MDNYLIRVDVAPLESCLTSKESRAVRRGADGKVPVKVTRRPPTLLQVRFGERRLEKYPATGNSLAAYSTVILLGHQTYLAAKAKGEISMSGKPRTRGSSLGGWLGKTRMTW